MRATEGPSCFFVWAFATSLLKMLLSARLRAHGSLYEKSQEFSLRISSCSRALSPAPICVNSTPIPWPSLE